MNLEQELNSTYSEEFTEEQVVEQFIYLTNKSRGNYTTENNIRKHYRNKTVGKLIKKYDPILFNVK